MPGNPKNLCCSIAPMAIPLINDFLKYLNIRTPGNPKSPVARQPQQQSLDVSHSCFQQLIYTYNMHTQYYGTEFHSNVDFKDVTELISQMLRALRRLGTQGAGVAQQPQQQSPFTFSYKIKLNGMLMLEGSEHLGTQKVGCSVAPIAVSFYAHSHSHVINGMLKFSKGQDAWEHKELDAQQPQQQSFPTLSLFGMLNCSGQNAWEHRELDAQWPQQQSFPTLSLLECLNTQVRTPGNT